MRPPRRRRWFHNPVHSRRGDDFHQALHPPLARPRSHTADQIPRRSSLWGPTPCLVLPSVPWGNCPLCTRPFGLLGWHGSTHGGWSEGAQKCLAADYLVQRIWMFTMVSSYTCMAESLNMLHVLTQHTHMCSYFFQNPTTCRDMEAAGHTQPDEVMRLLP